MPLWNKTDLDRSKPATPNMRTVRPTRIALTTNGTSNVTTSVPNTRLYFPSTTGVVNGMFVTANSTFTANTGRAFITDTAPYVVNVTATSVWVSANLAANIGNGVVFRFDTPISWDAGNNSIEKAYNANTYLVSNTRVASWGSDKGVAHQGWVKITQGVGPITNVTISSNGSGFAINSSGYLLIWGGQFGATANANIAYTTGATGNLATVSVTSGGKGFKGNSNTETISSNQYFNASGVANTPATWPTFTFGYGGRAGRVQSEVLVAMSSPSVTNSSSGGPYFTGT